MDSTELYRQLLGVTPPWTGERVDMDVAHLRVDVHLVHAGGARFACPECGAELGVYDHTEERIWRHLDSCHFQTLLHARPPRVQCPEHGVLRAKLPWAEPGGRFTNLFEALAVDVLLATDVKKAATILGITWDEAWHIMERAVRRGRAAKGRAVPEVIGVDEKAIAKGHRYMTLVCDLKGSTVEYIAEDRKQVSLQSYFDGFDTEALEAGRRSAWTCGRVHQRLLGEDPRRRGQDRIRSLSHHAPRRRCGGHGAQARAQSAAGRG